MEENAQMRMREVDEAQVQGESMQCQGAHGWWRCKACCDKGALQVLSRFRIDPLGETQIISPDEDRVAGKDRSRLCRSCSPYIDTGRDQYTITDDDGRE